MVGLHVNVIEYLLRVPWVWGFPWGFQWGFLWVWDGMGIEMPSTRQPCKKDFMPMFAYKKMSTFPNWLQSLQRSHLHLDLNLLPLVPCESADSQCALISFYLVTVCCFVESINLSWAVFLALHTPIHHLRICIYSYK